MTDRQIKIIAKWMLQDVEENDPDIDIIMAMDNAKDNAYKVLRSKSFTEAAIQGNIAAINYLLNQK